jgi:hypothetical protein
VLLGITVMLVHWKIVKEHKIDRKVLKEMRREWNIAFLAIILIIIGYLLELMAFGIAPDILCNFILGQECAQMLAS